MPDQVQIVDQPTPQSVDKVNETLFTFSTVFPFDFFPDDVVLDRFKINIVKRDFFFTERIVTIPLSDMLSVKVNKGPFFSQVVIGDMSTSTNKVKLTFVRNQDAEKFREIVQGIVVGIRQGVNLMEMTKQQLIASAEDWGTI